jgi:hypothetical protein
MLQTQSIMIDAGLPLLNQKKQCGPNEAETCEKTYEIAMAADQLQLCLTADPAFLKPAFSKGLPSGIL